MLYKTLYNKDYPFFTISIYITANIPYTTPAQRLISASGITLIENIIEIYRLF